MNSINVSVINKSNSIPIQNTECNFLYKIGHPTSGLSTVKLNQFQSINEILANKINGKTDTANNSFNNSVNPRINSPLRSNSPDKNNLSSSLKIMNVVKGGSNNNNIIQLQLNNNVLYKPEVKSLTPTNTVEKSNINLNAYNSNNGNINTGFYNKMLQRLLLR